MAAIRLMIIDDHEVICLGMRAAFELKSDINVVGEASNGADALAKISVLDPQVMLIDVRMEKIGGIEACREIKIDHPHIAVLMITSFLDEEAVAASIIAGASGYLLKNMSRYHA
jgi:two-component system response regulator DevR